MNGESVICSCKNIVNDLIVIELHRNRETPGYMVKHTEPDKILMKMPSLRAIKSFVAAAKYQSFTTAAESLCVTQAAISRQIRELESALGVKLFNRVGRAVELTEAGNIFYDAAYLSFVNIAQAAKRIDQNNSPRKEITLCCSPALSALWLSYHLPEFLRDNPDINVNVVTTNSVLNLEPGVHPDVYISKVCEPIEGYVSIPLFYDVIYPVCSAEYFSQHPEIRDLNNIEGARLLNLSPHGRAQLAEHVDWEVWMAEFAHDFILENHCLLTSNDYNLLIQMTLNHQGICLGWHHLVHELVQEGRLVRVSDAQAVYKEKCHYLAYDDSKSQQPIFSLFKEWISAKLKLEETSVIDS